MDIDNEDDDKRVRFGSVETRAYPMILGVNPAAKIGAPVCLSWEYQELPGKSIGGDTEQPKTRSHQKNKSPREFYLNYYQRVSILETAGFSQAEINKAEKSAKWDHTKRKLSEYESFPFLWIKSWKVQFARGKSRRFVKKYRNEHGLKGLKKKKRLSLPRSN